MSADDTSKKLDVILDAVKKLEARVARIEAGSATPNVDRTSGRLAPKKTSIREFLLQHPPNNDVQRTLAVGFFLEKHAGMSSFTAADLEKGYRDAKHKLPSNINMNVNHSIRNGHMMEGEEKKGNKTAWVLTAYGEEYVLANFAKTSSGK